jgi:hypothetical protein
MHQSHVVEERAVLLRRDLLGRAQVEVGVFAASSRFVVHREPCGARTRVAERHSSRNRLISLTNVICRSNEGSERSKIFVFTAA